MNSHESFGTGWDIVHDEQDRFVALIDPDGNVVEHVYCPPTNMIDGELSATGEINK